MPQPTLRLVIMLDPVDTHFYQNLRVLLKATVEKHRAKPRYYWVIFREVGRDPVHAVAVWQADDTHLWVGTESIEDPTRLPTADVETVEVHFDS